MNFFNWMKVNGRRDEIDERGRSDGVWHKTLYKELILI